MGFWTAIVLIVLIMAITGTLGSRSKRKSRDRVEEQDQPTLPSNREKELEDEVVSLRERVKVLERIATDPARRTAEEIEKLRDE
ncbi:hypothetical protein [Erythrobacter alti]|uniref:hypothetical protein n=1 Tax=Erythrobacter alti TaxID=1896145 RepID=UPI0030F40CDE